MSLSHDKRIIRISRQDDSKRRPSRVDKGDNEGQRRRRTTKDSVKDVTLLVIFSLLISTLCVTLAFGTTEDLLFQGEDRSLFVLGSLLLLFALLVFFLSYFLLRLVAHAFVYIILGVLFAIVFPFDFQRVKRALDHVFSRRKDN